MSKKRVKCCVEGCDINGRINHPFKDVTNILCLPHFRALEIEILEGSMEGTKAVVYKDDSMFKTTHMSWIELEVFKITQNKERSFSEKIDLVDHVIQSNK